MYTQLDLEMDFVLYSFLVKSIRISSIFNMFPFDSEDLNTAACDFQDAKNEITENNDDDMEFHDAINDELELDAHLQEAQAEASQNVICHKSQGLSNNTTELEKNLEEAELAIYYFFNNKFDEAKSIVLPHANTSMYHSMGRAMFSFLEAILTFERAHILQAGDELRSCLDICQKYRHKNTISESIGKKLKRTAYSALSDMEAHAELCMAEALLLQALLIFAEDESLTTLIKGGVQINHCYNNYKECTLTLSNREWQSQISKIHFESGVRMGMGTFNLMISLLPASVIKLLQFIGFSGDRDAGLEDLNRGYKTSGLRQVLCALTLLGYHLIVCYILGHQEGDLVLCDDILQTQLEKYPHGALFLFFKGRLEFMRGNLVTAEHWYKMSWRSQNVWPQFHHLSFWELLWVNCLKVDWREASLYASHLVESSKWSPTIYSYQKATTMLMLPNLTHNENQIIDTLMTTAPTYKQRIAGKSLPMEKFVCKKIERYFCQGKWLCLPAVELMYVWNTFTVLSKQHSLADGIYQIIECKFNELKNLKTQRIYDADNIALCLLLRGAFYRQMKKNSLAIKDLKECIALKNAVKDDKYIIAFANLEAGLIYADENQVDLAINTLEKIKKQYTRFSLESRLHFRIHTALMDLRKRVAK
ncbi:tetratricopeptide repeat protein 39B-like isoform X1 [Glossina fuscipes]|uniref:Tetratricopeptide repeat protein 39B-like isoform X1 n=2 Tax=Glossina fuscipes TaxID=7396 RepID=A0A9C6DPX7_9MUSC|nr:tetratricopeptide repeat protein 39B-like isoform X1 [Glossina fuscipes]